MVSRILVVAALLCLLVGCRTPEEPKFEEPTFADFEVTDTRDTMYMDMYPQILVTVENVGTATGYLVRCIAAAKDTSGVIIDSDLTYFVDGGDIHPGESAQDDVIFMELSSHDDYDTVDYQLSWYTRN